MIGLGLKAAHYAHVIEFEPGIDFFEVHAENFMMRGGSSHRYLTAIAERYPLSLHGVGMSLGSAEGLHAPHLENFRKLVDQYRPILISEHLAWSRLEGEYFNDLLPLPLTDETLRIVSRNVSYMQDVIGRQVLIENPSSYLSFTHSEMTELEFLIALASSTGCGLLVDVNNIYVSANNIGGDCSAYIDAIPSELIGEVHLAGHTTKDVDGRSLLIDDHGSIVSPEVWDLYRKLIARVGAKPTLIEWDSNVPEFKLLCGEAGKAAAVLDSGAVH